jgi:DNA-binding Lrp family transcriptional regulator
MPGIYALINIYVESKSIDKISKKLQEMEEVIDLYEVTGDYDLVALVKTEDPASFRKFLKEKILSLEGIRGTNTVVILHTGKRNGEVVEE